MAAPDVEVTILENDIPGVTVAPEALEVREGSSEIYTVVLDTEPTGPVEGADGDGGRRRAGDLDPYGTAGWQRPTSR